MMKANSSIRLVFSRPLDHKGEPVTNHPEGDDLPAYGGYFDLTTAEIHESITKEEADNFIFLEITPCDAIATCNLSEGGLDSLGESRHSEEYGYVHYYEDFLEAAKVADVFLKNNPSHFEFEVEIGYEYSAGQDNTIDSSDYWSEYVPVGIVIRKEYVLEDFDVWFKKEMDETGPFPKKVKKKKKVKS